MPKEATLGEPPTFRRVTRCLGPLTLPRDSDAGKFHEAAPMVNTLGPCSNRSLVSLTVFVMRHVG
jgi:hypothetical protein